MNEKNQIEVSETNVIVEDKKRDYLLPASILIAGLMISGSVVYLVGSKSAPAAPNAGANIGVAVTPPPAAPTALPSITSRDVVLGQANAPVTLFEYADYQCPFCGKFFTDAEGQIRDNYVKTGKVKMVFKNFQFLGPESNAAAEAAECAKDQSKFWAYHDALYVAKIKDASNGENDGFFGRTELLSLAQGVGMDMNSFTSCIDGNKYKDQVTKDSTDAQTVGVNSTPTVFVNGTKLLGALPYAQFAAAIDAALKTK